jgi:hypothetical protein
MMTTDGMQQEQQGTSMRTMEEKDNTIIITSFKVPSVTPSIVPIVMTSLEPSLRPTC